MIAQIRSLVHGHSGRVTVGVAAGMAFAIVAAVVALLVVVAGPSGSTSAGDVVEPTFVAGNPDCEDFGLVELVKVEPVEGGTFDGINLTVPSKLNGSNTFDWTSKSGTIGLIIVKGGPNANVYVYDPASSGDQQLHAPANRGRFFGLSHISFCDPGTPETPTSTSTATATSTATDTPPPTITPRDEEEKCTDRKDCPTPEPKATATPKGDPAPGR